MRFSQHGGRHFRLCKRLSEDDTHPVYNATFAKYWRFRAVVGGVVRHKRLIVTRLTVSTAALLMCVMPANGQETKVSKDTVSNQPGVFLRDPPKPMTMKGAFRLVSIGELLYSYPMATSPDAEFQKVAKLIADGDVTIGIQEGQFLDLETYKGLPLGGGLWGVAGKAKDERALGIDMVSVANNHSNDWGHEALRETQRLLDDAGIVHSGGGETLTDARKPGILNTPQGRIALIATASTFRTYANATDAYGMAPARPGISGLRLRRVNLVTPEHFKVLRQVAIDSTVFSHKPPRPDAQEVTVGSQTYRAASQPGVAWDMNLYDHAALLRSVREAKAQNDFVVFTIHAHESPTGMDDDNPDPPKFLIELFHNVVDAGADFVHGGGNHAMRGIEIYKGRPILYGIGAFFLSGDIKQMQDTAYDAFPGEPGAPPPPIPDPNAVITAKPGGVNPAKWYDGVVVKTDYEGGKVRQLRLYPLDLGNTFDLKRRGIPHLASAENARRILEDIRAYSARFGTKITIEGSTGIVRIP